uniref:Uncharacterized protein n=1 Tax=Phenylobacterium glaciei TaxID=2803784 RepID=A0A974S999_9CAUL|nr:hypothetical protein JKL49_02070 [Phenylobacterium glaciei]
MTGVDVVGLEDPAQPRLIDTQGRVHGPSTWRQSPTARPRGCAGSCGPGPARGSIPGARSGPTPVIPKAGSPAPCTSAMTRPPP